MFSTLLSESKRTAPPLKTLTSGVSRGALPKLLLGGALLAGGTGSVLSAGSAKAFTQVTQPDAAYLSSTTLIDISSIPDFTLLSSVTDGTQTVGFGTTVSKRTVPINWGTWGSPPATETSTPPLLYSDGQTSLTLSLSNPSNIFGFELEPDPFGVQNFTVEFYDSAATRLGTLGLSPNGNAGALLSAASDGNLFSQVVIKSDSGVDFAIAQLRYGKGTPPPVPGPLPLFGAAAAFGFSRKLRKRIKARSQA